MKTFCHVNERAVVYYSDLDTRL